VKTRPEHMGEWFARDSLAKLLDFEMYSISFVRRRGNTIYGP